MLICARGQRSIMLFVSSAEQDEERTLLGRGGDGMGEENQILGHTYTKGESPIKGSLKKTTEGEEGTQNESNYPFFPRGWVLCV